MGVWGGAAAPIIYICSSFWRLCRQNEEQSGGKRCAQPTDFDPTPPQAKEFVNSAGARYNVQALFWCSAVVQWLTADISWNIRYHGTNGVRASHAATCMPCG